PTRRSSDLNSVSFSLSIRSRIMDRVFVSYSLLSHWSMRACVSLSMFMCLNTYVVNILVFFKRNVCFKHHNLRRHGRVSLRTICLGSVARERSADLHP